jgi:hypothetical protein
VNQYQREAIEALPAMQAAVEGEMYLYADASQPTADETRHDLRILVDQLAARIERGDVQRVMVLAVYECSG